MTQTIDAFVIGAMKAATTGMCDWLAVQPGVTMSEPKEPSIFVSDEAVDHGVPHIVDLFAHARSGDVRIDGSTDYAKFPEIDGVPRRVQQHNPEARLVYLMRHPVDRLISQFRFEWLLGAPTMSFEQALTSRPGLVDFSRYALQLEQWLEQFPPDRFLLVFSEAFASDPEGQVTRVLDFLGVDRPTPLVRPDAERSNETALLVRPSLARRVLRDSAVGRAVRPLLPNALALAYRRRLDARSAPYVPDEVRVRLEDALDSDLRHLSRLIKCPGLACATWHDLAVSHTPALRPA